MTNSDEVLFNELPGKGGNIGHIVLNRPAVLNALNHTMIVAMTKQLTNWEHNANIKAVLIEANGDRAFCAGGDLRHTHSIKETFFRDEYRLNSLIHHYPKPYIAFLDGITMGGGVGISIHGSHRIVTEKFLFAMPETGIGLFPDVGGTYFLPRLPKRAGYYLGLTGARIKSSDCIMLGIAQNEVAHDKLISLRESLVDTAFTENANTLVTAIIEQYSTSSNSAPLTEHLSQLDNWFAKSSMEDIVDTLKLTKNSFADEIIHQLSKKSPASLKVTLEALRRGQQLDFDECMKMEYHLVCRFLKEHDFAEGIRAVIIDKDQKPHWQPATLSELTQKVLDSYF